MSPRIQAGAERTVEQPTPEPTAKVTAAGTAGAAAGAASILIVFIAGELGLEISNEVAAAITALLTTLLAVAGGYLKRERAVTRADVRERVTGERGQTNVWFLLGALTVAVLVLAFVVFT